MKKLIYIVCILTFICCTDKYNNTELLQEKENNNYYIPKDSAIKIAVQAVSSLEKSIYKNTTRICTKREIKNIFVIQSLHQTTRYNDINRINTELYLINFKGNKGFALVSSDKRLQPIYALSDSGSLNVLDTINNKGLAMFFNGVYRDILYTSSTKVPKHYYLNGCHYLLGAQVPPLIQYNTRKWGQKPPYNKYCFTEQGDSALVGCVAVATGMVMSYYKWPTDINNTHINWLVLNNGQNIDPIAKFLNLLGNKQLLDMQYGIFASEANVQNIYQTFEKLGYYRPKDIIDFNSDIICQQLTTAYKQGASNSTGAGPILVYGENNKNKNGHLWVIDGYAENVEIDNDYTMYFTLFHCNWGWNGRNNGYFYLKDNTLGDQYVFKDIDDKKYDDEQNNNNYQRLKIIYAFRKNYQTNGKVNF